MLPRGNTLPPESWHARHRAILILAAAHAVALPLYGIARGYGVLHCVLEGSAIAALALVAAIAGRQERTRLASAAASMALLTGSALVVHLSGGVIEAHFHFFVMVVVLTLYEDWVPFSVALLYVVIHHGLLGAIDPASIYSHPGAQADPLKWGAIHAAFVAAAGVAGISTWKHNEQARDRALGIERDADKLYRSVVETLTEGVLLPIRALRESWGCPRMPWSGRAPPAMTWRPSGRTAPRGHTRTIRSCSRLVLVTP